VDSAVGLATENPVDSIEGKVVAIIHPAWHSCGSYQVFRAQSLAYQAMGARVAAIAVGTTLDQGSRNKRFWESYYHHTGDLVVDWRAHTGPSRYSLIFDSERRRIARELIEADYARQMAGLADLSPVPPLVDQLGQIDLIHCNHYFNMPLAMRLKQQFNAPVLLETHDVQSRQYQLRDAKSLFRKRHDNFGTMLQSELQFVEQADWLAHINIEESEFFKQKLPEMRHTLLYPAMFDETSEDEDHAGYFLIVASGNYPNYESVAWFLRRVLPLCAGVKVKIIGNIDYEVKTRQPSLYECHKAKFLGRVDNLAWFYDNALAVLLPTRSGHGLSIKTIEAMATGAPLIGTSLAFRGMDIDFNSISNITLADTEEGFAALINAARTKALEETIVEGDEKVAKLKLVKKARSSADSRQLAKRLFSFQSYLEKLSYIAGQLVTQRAS